MPNNMILLETIELTQSAASVTFDNLPTSGYTDLKIVVSARTDRSGQNADDIKLQVNGNTSAIYSQRRVLGNGSATFSDSSSGSNVGVGFTTGPTATANTFGNVDIYIPNYRSSTNKSVSVDGVSENNATGAGAVFNAFLATTTSPISSINLAPLNGTIFLTNSTFSLYGIAALGTIPVLAPKATGGNRVENDGTYWIHTFLSSGVFTPQTGLTCDYLVVAGGGGGGGDSRGGGGGAGGFRSTVTATGGGGSLETALTLAINTNYTVTVGAGGAGAGADGTGTSGSNSIFSTITSTGGGGGAEGGVAGPTQNGVSGGSGGGGGGYTTGTGGAGTANQGYAGGTGSTNPFFGAGGGGGAGAVGASSTSNNGGAGGNGVATSISGSSVTYAGGGGGGATATGGAGGSGGGGAGANSGPVVGTINTGGGGGGGSSNGAAGGSGIVIIRYPIA